jgi:peptidoglycan L-alanyl-D-glutamate endopeptidase CwlK
VFFVKSPHNQEPKMPSFGSKSKAALAKCHPLLQDIANQAIKKFDFMVLDATRGRVDQERAFAGGRSKARFGQSAHNYVPAIAFDLFPAPYDWNNRQSFIDLYRVIMRIAREKGIPLRSGLDWNMDGNFSDGWDAPHYELNPWREWAKKSKLFEG